MRRVITTLIEALFRVLFTYDCLGEENIPPRGPAVVAANHPSYLDPVLLSLQAQRPIRFMAWDALFRVPLLGALIRTFGAFPVDTRRGKGREAYERAKALVQSGEVVGLFPEGHRSRTGWMEPHLREGAARLSWETGALLVPATIAGAYRAWPHFQALPRPARIRVRYHEPIDPAPYRGQPEEVALPALLAELQRRVDRSLQPGVKADLRMMLLYAAPAPLPRAHEVAAAAWWRSCCSCTPEAPHPSCRPPRISATSGWTGASCRSPGSRSGFATCRQSCSCSRADRPSCARWGAPPSRPGPPSSRSWPEPSTPMSTCGGGRR
jgi:1-acyl-sn-glycerol-3-phosphate acyltransferase